MRFLYLLLVLSIILWIIRLLMRKPDQTETPTKKMVACQRCGLYLPENEALLKDGHYYCCKRHRDQA